MTTIPVDAVVYREDLYPRLAKDPALVQRYAEHIDVMPPIEVNQHRELIDGWHRWTAHKKAERAEVPVTITETASDVELLALAIRRNASHGKQLEERDKKSAAIRLYAAGTGLEKNAIADVLSVTERAVRGYLSDVEKQLREQRDETIRSMWLACASVTEIADAVGVTAETVNQRIGDIQKAEALPKSEQLTARYAEPDWTPPLFDIWNPGKKSSAQLGHYGNTCMEFVDNLLYTFTEPFDIVIDPFAGGGSTIDVCKKRLRRYWVSDRKPIPERAEEIRQHDVVTDGVTGPYHWGEVALVYLDPPYWKQAAGKYSDDPTDLANMPLEQFTDAMVGIIEGYGKKMHEGAHVACIISPTQWPNEDKSTVYHDIDFAARVKKNLRLVRRVICPYSTEQYNGTQVNIAKEQKLWLTLSRTMLVWQVV
jgi:hypothetical protein